MTKGHHAVQTVSVSWNDENPAVLVPSDDGLTKREYFAAMAMQGFLSHAYKDGTWGSAAKDGVLLADALIEALNAQEQP